MLHQHFAIVKNYVRMHYQLDIKDILLACLALHNMIVEDERDDGLPADWDFIVRANARVRRTLSSQDLREYFRATHVIEDNSTHFMLRKDLIAHLWDLKGKGHRFGYEGSQE